LAELKNYADFNNVTFQGRIASSKIVTGPKGDFLAVTVMSNLTSDKTASITFASRGSLMTAFDKGLLPVGRVVTVIGRIQDISDVYLDKKSGQTMLRKYPQIDLGFECMIPAGGLGPLPKSAQTNRVVGAVVTAPVDKAPSYEEELLDDQPNQDAVEAIAESLDKAVASGDAKTAELLAKPEVTPAF